MSHMWTALCLPATARISTTRACSVERCAPACTEHHPRAGKAISTVRRTGRRTAKGVSNRQRLFLPFYQQTKRAGSRLYSPAIPVYAKLGWMYGWRKFDWLAVYERRMGGWAFHWHRFWFPGCHTYHRQKFQREAQGQVSYPTPNTARVARLRPPPLERSPRDGDKLRCLEICASASAFSSTNPQRPVEIRIQRPPSIEGCHPQRCRATSSHRSQELAR